MDLDRISANIGAKIFTEPIKIILRDFGKLQFFTERKAGLARELA